MMTPREREDLETELVTLEEDILPDLRESLAELTQPDYRPEDNPDHEPRDIDVDFLETEIARVERRIRALKYRLGLAEPE